MGESIHLHSIDIHSYAFIRKILPRHYDVRNLMSSVAVTPFDVVKTRLQAQQQSMPHQHQPIGQFVILS